MPSQPRNYRDIFIVPPPNKKKLKKKSEIVNLCLKQANKKISFMKKSVLAHTHILVLAKGTAFVPKMHSETPSCFLDAFLISSSSYISAANAQVTKNKHSISSLVELFHPAYLGVQFCCLHFNHIFQQHSALCIRPFSFMKDKNDCIFHFIFLT